MLQRVDILLSLHQSAFVFSVIQFALQGLQTIFCSFQPPLYVVVWHGTQILIGCRFLYFDRFIKLSLGKMCIFLELNLWRFRWNGWVRCISWWGPWICISRWCEIGVLPLYLERPYLLILTTVVIKFILHGLINFLVFCFLFIETVSECFCLWRSLNTIWSWSRVFVTVVSYTLCSSRNFYLYNVLRLTIIKVLWLWLISKDCMLQNIKLYHSVSIPVTW